MQVFGDEELSRAFEMFSDFIAGETLCAKIEFSENAKGGSEIEADEKIWSVKIEKA